MVPISLGFSCQTRFAIDGGTAATATMPFDWTITTRSFLVDALASDGKAFEIIEAKSSIYTMPEEKTAGVHMGGVFFWHDFPRQEDQPHPQAEWRDHIADVNENYRKRWGRFRNLLRNFGVHKRLIISNSQKNLIEFSTDESDFNEKFGLDEDFLLALCDRLNSWAARNYRITFLVRSLRGYEKIIDAQTRMPGIFDVRFAGAMSLPANNRLVSSIFMEVPDIAAGLLPMLAGRYVNGVEIVLRGKSALVYHPVSETLWAEAVPFPGGYIFVFEGDDAIFTARFVNGAIEFSNNTQWAKFDAHVRCKIER